MQSFFYFISADRPRFRLKISDFVVHFILIPYAMKATIANFLTKAVIDRSEMSNLEGIVSDGIHLLILYVDIPKDIENICTCKQNLQKIPQYICIANPNWLLNGRLE